MMRLLLAVLFLGTVSCAIFSRAREENLGQIHEGQSKAQVLEILGEPETQNSIGPVENWHYLIISSDNRQHYPYTGTFENGVLTKWFFDQAREEQEGRGPKKGGGGPRPNQM